MNNREVYEWLRSKGVPDALAREQAGLESPQSTNVPPGAWNLRPPAVFPSFPPAPAAKSASRPGATMMEKEPPVEPQYPTGRPSDGMGRIEPKRGSGYAEILDKPRRWASADSKFTLEGGQLVGVHPNGQVDILRPDGRIVHPHVSELSPEDQQHVRVQRERRPMAAAEAADKNVASQRAAGPLGRPATAEKKAKEAQAALRASRAPLPPVGGALPRAGDLASARDAIDAPPAAKPRRGRAAPQAVPQGYFPVDAGERTWRGRGEMYEEPGSLDRTPKMLETPSPYSRHGRVIGVHPDGTVLIQQRDGSRVTIPLSKLNGADAAHVLGSMPSGLAGRVSLGDPREVARLKAARERYMWEEKTGFVGDGRDLADTEAKLAEFRRQRRAGLRPGTNDEQQYEMFGPGGDDAAARAEAQANIDAQVAAGANRDKQVRQSIDRDKAKYGPGQGVTQFDKDGNPIAAAPLTFEQKKARFDREEAEDRAVANPNNVEVMIARLARANGISRGEARAMYEANLKAGPADGEDEETPAAAAAQTRAAMQTLRDGAGSKRDEQLASQRDALRRRNMLAGNDPRSNLTNAFGTMDKEWQDYVMARLMGANPGTSPSDAAIEREKLDVARAESEARTAEAARAGRQADRANDLAERGLGLKEKEQDLEAEARAQAESAATRNLVIEHHGLPMPAGAAGKLVGAEISAGQFDHPEVVKFIDNSAIKLLKDSGAFSDNAISDEEAAAVDAILIRLGVGYAPGSWKKAAESEVARRIADHAKWSDPATIPPM